MSSKRLLLDRHLDDTPPGPASTLCTSDQRNVTQRDAGLTCSRKRVRVGYLSERILQPLQYYITNNKMSGDINVQTRGACRVASRCSIITYERNCVRRSSNRAGSGCTSHVSLRLFCHLLHLIREDRAATCPSDRWYHMKRWSQWAFKSTPQQFGWGEGMEGSQSLWIAKWRHFFFVFWLTNLAKVTHEKEAILLEQNTQWQSVIICVVVNTPIK